MDHAYLLLRNESLHALLDLSIKPQSINQFIGRFSSGCLIARTRADELNDAVAAGDVVVVASVRCFLLLLEGELGDADRFDGRLRLLVDTRCRMSSRSLVTASDFAGDVELEEDGVLDSRVNWRLGVDADGELGGVVDKISISSSSIARQGILDRWHTTEEIEIEMIRVDCSEAID